MILSASNSVAKSDQIFEIQKVGEWLTSNEAAKFLGLSTNALRIMVCRDQVKFRKLGSRLRFSRDDLRLLLRKGV
jgi:excisionase family DNA binding protein